MPRTTRSRGFGLIEVLVFGAIAAIVSLATATLFKNLFKGNRQAVQQAEAFETVFQIRQALRVPSQCTCNLTPTPPYSFDTTKVGTPTPPVIAVPSIALYNSMAGCVAGPVLGKVTATAPASGIWITAMQLQDLFQLDAIHYAANLHVSITQMSGTQSGYQNAKDVMVILDVTGPGPIATITGCF